MALNNKGSGSNSFNDGINTDSHPLVVKNTEMIDALNVEILTVGENQYVLKNIPGDILNENAGVGFALTEGFIPLAAKSYNNIAYIVSGKFNTDGTFVEGELGTFPSPKWSDYSNNNKKLGVDIVKVVTRTNAVIVPFEDRNKYTLTRAIEFTLTDASIGRDVILRYKLNDNGIFSSFDTKKVYMHEGAIECSVPVDAQVMSDDAEWDTLMRIDVVDMKTHTFTVYITYETSTSLPRMNKSLKYLTPCAFNFVSRDNVKYTQFVNNSTDVATSTIQDVSGVAISLSDSELEEFYTKLGDPEASLSFLPNIKMEDYYDMLRFYMNKYHGNINDMVEFPKDTLSIFSMEYAVDGKVVTSSNNVRTDLVKVYSPIHNFLTEENTPVGSDCASYINPWEVDACHTMPFRTKEFEFNLNDFIDLTLQQEYDRSVNFIFTDNNNPIRFINSRFRLNSDGSATIIDRRQAKDTNTYSAKFFKRTDLIIKSTSVAKLDFIGVEKGGVLLGGGYRYYFRHKNADGNLSDILAESRLVSIHFGNNRDAYGVSGDKKTNKLVKFMLSGLDVTSGSIEVSVTHVSGDSQPVAKSYKINERYYIADDGSCAIQHSGLEEITVVNEETINTSYSAISTVKTLDQINNRLVLGNVSSNIDETLFDILDKLTQRIRVNEVIEGIKTSYGDPFNVYNNLGFWGGETYELGVVYILDGGSLTPAFPVRGLDNYKGGEQYSGDIILGEDLDIRTSNGIVGQDEIDTIPSINRFENVRGLYRTFHDKHLLKKGRRQVTKLVLDMTPITSINNKYLGYLKSNIIGYFVVRKTRNKDTLYQGLISPTAVLPIGNIDTVVGSYDFIGFRRNTATYIARNVYPTTPGEVDQEKTYIGWDKGQSPGLGLAKSSDLKHNLYDLVTAHVPQYASAIPLIHPSGIAFPSEKGRVPRSNKVVFFSGDFEVDGINMASILNNANLNINIVGYNSNTAIRLTSMTNDTSRVQYIRDITASGVESPPSLQNLEGDLKYKGKFVYVPNGVSVAAEGQFTSQIDRTYNFAYTSIVGNSGQIKYRHRDGYKDRAPDSGMIYIEYWSWGAAAMKIHVTDANKINREGILKVLRKGDIIYVPTVNREYSVDSSPVRHGNYFQFDTSPAQGIVHDWDYRHIEIHFQGKQRLKFYPVAYLPKKSIAMGYASTVTDYPVSLWDDGQTGINKASWWDNTGTANLYPYASVVNNWSKYIGVELFNPTNYNSSYKLTQHSPLTGKMKISLVNSTYTFELSYINAAGKRPGDDLKANVSVGSYVDFIIAGETSEFIVRSITIPTHGNYSFTAEATDPSASAMDITNENDLYTLNFTATSTLEFEHFWKNDILYLAEIKATQATLTSTDLAEIYSSTNSLPYFSTTDRLPFGETDTVVVADGDCFITKVFKRTTYAMGIMDAPAATFSDFNTYGSGPTQEWTHDIDENITTGWKSSSSSETMDEGRKLASNGMIVEIISQTNHNADVRSYEKSDPMEMMLYGSERGFHPAVAADKLYSEYRPDSSAYNRGLTGDYRAVSYVGISVEAPTYTLQYPNRIMISAPNIQSEFFNGYRDFSGINFKDYNSELGQIVKLINHNNNLFCIFENGVALITVDGRTLVNSQEDIYVDDAQALASKARVIDSTIGSVNPESIIRSFNTIYGVDFIRNKIWRVSGSSIEILSDYKIESYLLKAKKELVQLKSDVGIPKIYTSFDSVKKNVYFSYNKLLNDKSGGLFSTYGTVYYNEVMNRWVSRTSYTPKFQLTDNEYNLLFDVSNRKSEAWATGVNSTYCKFHGTQHTFHVEFVMHERPDMEKILTNIQILSNKIKPKTIQYSITTDVPNAVLRQNKINYYDDNGDIIDEPDYTDIDNVFNTVFEENIYIREDSSNMSIGIFKENAYYRDGKYLVQVGKVDSFSRFNNSSRRVRDKYFKIKITYSGEDYTYLYNVISLFTNNYD